MALEPVIDTPVSSPSPEADMAAKLETALLGAPTPPAEPEPPAAPAAPEPPAEPEPPAAPEPPADPIKALTDDKDKSDANKLPIEDEETEEPVEPEPTGDKAGKRIQALKEEIKTVYKPKLTELETTLKTKEARISELEATAAKAKELEDQIAQYKKEISVVRLEQTPEFKSLVTEPLKDLSDKVTSIADAYGIEKSDLVSAIAEPDETKRRVAFKNLMSGLDVDIDDQIKLREIAAKTHEIYAKEDELYADADKALSELAARREAETAAQAALRSEERAKAADTAAAAILKAMPFLGDTLPDLAKKVKDTPLETLDPTRAAYNALAGEALPKVKAALNKMQKENDDLLDELAKYRKATPRVGGNLGTAPTTTRHTDLAAAIMQGAGMI